MGVISLIQLNASRNHISDIHEEAFVGQSKLQAVDLSSNNISYIGPNTFARNPSLERLSISSNQFLALPEEGPLLRSASLRVLFLSACSLRHIPPKTFENVPNLQELHISHNRIEILFPLQGVGLLTLLDLSNNYLTALDFGIFTAFPRLLRLNLSYNRLNKLDIVPQLANITSSEELNGNPWECECNVFCAAYSWCHDNGVNLRLVCSSPPKVKDRLWTAYGEECCDYDDSDYMGEVAIIDNGSPSIRRHENYEMRQASMYFPTQIRELDINVYHNIYFYCSIVLSALCLCAIIVAGVMCCYLIINPSMRTVPVQSDVEECHL
jgi:Leucine-rich repeat (LRR) protein